MLLSLQLSNAICFALKANPISKLARQTLWEQIENKENMAQVIVVLHNSLTGNTYKCILSSVYWQNICNEE